jgi:hypothetical protein
MREATMPTTPSWKSGSNTHMAPAAPPRRPRTALGDLQRLLAHAALDVAPLAVDAVQHARQFVGARRVVGQQALDAQRHVGQPAGRVDARAEREAEVEGGGDLALRPAAVNSAASPHGMAPARMRFRPCATRRRLLASSLTTSATVPSATRAAAHRAWAAWRVEHAARAQLGAQRQQHVEHHADAGDRLALEVAARLVRVDDHGGLGSWGRAGGGRSPAPAGRARWRRPRRRRWRCRCPR